MPKQTVDDLTQVICAAIDGYRVTVCPNMMVSDIIASIERIRHGLTEKLIAKQKIRT